jgi:hypothetical protein
VDISRIDVTAIDAIAPKLLTAHKSQRVTNLKTVVGFVRNMRKAQQAGDWTEVARLLDDMNISGVEVDHPLVNALAMCKKEVELAAAEVLFRRVTRQLQTALSEGRVEGKPGRVALGQTDVRQLTSAVTSAEAAMGLGNVPALVAVAHAVIVMRTAVLAGDWERASETARGIGKMVRMCVCGLWREP